MPALAKKQIFHKKKEWLHRKKSFYSWLGFRSTEAAFHTEVALEYLQGRFVSLQITFRYKYLWQRKTRLWFQSMLFANNCQNKPNTHLSSGNHSAAKCDVAMLFRATHPKWKTAAIVLFRGHPCDGLDCAEKAARNPTPATATFQRKLKQPLTANSCLDLIQKIKIGRSHAATFINGCLS